MNDDRERPDLLARITGLLSLIQSTVQFWGPVCVGLVAWLLRAPWYVILGGMIAVLVLLFLLSRRLRLALAERFLSLAHHSLLPIDKTFECRNKVAEYTYEDRETMTFRVSYEVKIHSGSSKHILDRIKWSAGDVDNIRAIEQGQRISLISTNDDILFQLGFQSFRIDFSRDYSKEDGFFPTGYYCQCPPDPEHKAMPCLVMGVYQKLDRLTLRLRFNKSLNVENVRKRSYSRYLDAVSYKSEYDQLKLSKDQKYNYVDFTIDHPIPGGKYAIDWVFPEP